jgi:hypothetical protein
MDLHWILLSALATFVYVFLRALQQKNVQGDHYWRVLPTSIGMGVGDVILVLLIVKTESLWMGVTNGIAGGLGCMVAMYLNKHLNLRTTRAKRPAEVLHFRV